MAVDIVALDTNIAIEILNYNQKTIAQLSQYGQACLPVTVCGELLWGAVNSGRRFENLPRFKSFIAKCNVLPVDREEIALEYAAVKFTLKKSGKCIPENDVWIAATCICYNIPLLTRDHHFDYIEKLPRI